jgi:hypothetical protein
MGDLEHAVRRRAYALGDEAGCPEGRGDEFWYAARAEFKEDRTGRRAPVDELGPPIEEPPEVAFPARNPGWAARGAHRRAGGHRRPARTDAEPDAAPSPRRLTALVR